MQPTQFPKILLQWYDQQGRKHLPWRQDISPYRVWISEIMLQQTQVKTVIPYFLRFMTCFPNLNALAEAAEDEVLAQWTGLGYYSRARNLHKTAKKIISDFQGEFPKTLLEIQSLPGIGRSTAAAILAIAMNQKAAILDGNVRRILSRLHMLEEKTASAMEKKLWELAESYSPDLRIGDYTQAIMDLGASICLRSRPLCQTCPVQVFCQANQHNRVAEFPKPKNAIKVASRSTRMLIFYQADRHEVLLEKRPPVGIWGGLWSFPECSADENLEEFCQKHYGYRVLQTDNMPEFKHTFSHLHLFITPVVIAFTPLGNQIRENDGRSWHKLNQGNQARGFAAPIKRLLADLRNLTTHLSP